MPELRVTERGGELMVHLGATPLLHHSANHPAAAVLYGRVSFDMAHGNFTRRVRNRSRVPLRRAVVRERRGSSGVTIAFGAAVGAPTVVLVLDIGTHWVEIGVSGPEDAAGVRLSLASAPGAQVHGAGEQFSRWNLRGSRVPLWTAEQGVGRKGSFTKLVADLHNRSGGGWHTTYFPQPSFVTTAGRAVISHSDAYTVLDFARRGRDVIEVWEPTWSLSVYHAREQDGGHETPLASAGKALAVRLGTQPRQPAWADQGLWLGLQGGREVVERKLETARGAGIQVAALWVQDWEGKRVTAFGSQLFWDWRYDAERYPDLPGLIQRLRSEGVRFTGYLNPFLAIEGKLYQEASACNYCVKTSDGSDYLVTVTTFPAAVLDLSNPEACEWIKGVIKTNMIGIGLSGWMADFGEYLPTDARLARADAATFHNRYPAEWARVNREAIDEAGAADEVSIFMRAGYTGSSRYTNSVWAGDQMVDWSLHDGLASVIPAALSMGLSGIGVHHSDIGGYTTLYHKRRGKELFQRWAEQAAFTPQMRTHEGNRPADNWQWDGDAQTMHHLAQMVRVFCALRPYRQAVLDQYYRTGLPAMRPVELHYPDAGGNVTSARQAGGRWGASRYLFGRDLLVAPVLEKGVRRARVRLPQDDWVHLWSGARYSGGTAVVAAPLGAPPVFWRAESEHREVFAGLGR